MALRSRHSWWEWKVGLLVLAGLFFVGAVLNLVAVKVPDVSMALVSAILCAVVLALVAVGESVNRHRKQTKDQHSPRPLPKAR
jgi:hypothetical protein